MKVQKLTDEDLEPLEELYKFLESTCPVRRYDVAEFPNGEEFDKNNIDHLTKFYDTVQENSDNLFLLLVGYHTMRENCCNKNEDMIEFNPEITQALNEFRARQELPDVTH